MAEYPGAIPDFTPGVRAGTVRGGFSARRADELIALAEALGLDPAGRYVSVRDRLDVLEASGGNAIFARSHGVTGTAQSTDTGNLQEAIDASVDAWPGWPQGGKPVIILPAGDISLTSQLDRKGCLLVGAGPFTGTRLVWNGSTGTTAFRDSFSNSMGGFSGLSFVPGSAEPATWIDLTEHLVDETMCMSRVTFADCSHDAIKVGTWINLQWTDIRFDNPGRFAISATPPSGSVQSLSNFVIDRFTYDHHRASAPGEGFILIDNSAANSPHLGQIEISTGRIEVNTAWTGRKAIAVIKQAASPTGSSSAPLRLRGISYDKQGMTGDVAVYRDTVDTSITETVIIEHSILSRTSALFGGTWHPGQQFPTTIDAGGTMVGSVPTMEGITLRPSSYGAALEVRPHTSQTHNVVDVYNPAGAVVNSFDNNGVLRLGGSGPRWVTGTTGTGSASAALGANSPATVPTAPYAWLKATAPDGTTVYIPAWK